MGDFTAAGGIVTALWRPYTCCNVTAHTSLPLEILRVSGTSRPNAIAGAVAALLRSQGQVDIQAIGPTAVNQTVKALAIARGYLVDDALDLYTQPEFVKLDVQQEERTAVRFHVQAMPLLRPDESGRVD